MGKCCMYAHENGCAHIYYLKVPLCNKINIYIITYSNFQIMSRKRKQWWALFDKEYENDEEK